MVPDDPFYRSYQLRNECGVDRTKAISDRLLMEIVYNTRNLMQLGYVYSIMPIFVNVSVLLAICACFELDAL